MMRSTTESAQIFKHKLETTTLKCIRNAEDTRPMAGYFEPPESGGMHRATSSKKYIEINFLKHVVQFSLLLVRAYQRRVVGFHASYPVPLRFLVFSKIQIVSF